MIKIPVAGAIIINKNKILLIRRSKTDNWPMIWEFPRGKVRKGEDVKEGLLREVKEETGLNVKIINFIDKYVYIADEGKRISTQYNFLCEIIDKDQPVKLSFEHDEFMWVESVGQIELLVPSEMKKSISKVLNRNRMIVNYDMENNEEKIDEMRIYEDI